MTIERLREVHTARPFRPYVLVMADGSRIPVRHPEYLAFGGRTAVAVDRNGTTRFIDLLLVTTIEVPESSGRNGSHARRRRSN